MGGMGLDVINSVICRGWWVGGMGWWDGLVGGWDGWVGWVGGMGWWDRV